MGPSRLILLCFLMAALSGCATTATISRVEELGTIRANPRILLITPDVKYYVWTAGGVKEPRADWSATAEVNFQKAVQEYAAEHGVEIVTLDRSGDSAAAVLRYKKLHGAVGSTIQINHFGEAKLPTKAGRFDWGLGPGVSEIGRAYDADYALFAFYRDYQASGGRIAFAILAAAAGVGIPTTAEFGFASLVDLTSGDIVWFNKVDVGVGELRDAGGAKAVIDTLFKGLPEG